MISCKVFNFLSDSQILRIVSNQQVTITKILLFFKMIAFFKNMTDFYTNFCILSKKLINSLSKVFN